MYKKLIRKISFKKTYLQLRGAKILKEKNDPFFVSNTVSSLSEVSLDLNEKDFPRCLVGSHAAKVEIRSSLLRDVSSPQLINNSPSLLIKALNPFSFIGVQSASVMSGVILKDSP